MVASSQANLFASCAAGVCALWGPLHGGANQAVLEMLADIHASGDDGSKFITAAKDKNSAARKEAAAILEWRGTSPRNYKNALVFLAASGTTDKSAFVPSARSQLVLRGHSPE